MKPLPKKVRILTQTIFLIFFIILGPIILINSFGYHFGSFGELFNFVKTGGIYVASDISGVQIYVDDEYYKDSGLFLRNTLVQDLDPEVEHKIVVQKEGLHDWVKVLPVYESLVTEARVLMLPTEIEKEAIYPFFDELDNGTTTATSTAGLTKSKDIDAEFLVDGYIPTNPEYRQLINLFADSETDVYSTSTSLIEDINQKTIELSDLDAATTSTTTRDVPKYFARLGVEDPDDLENLIIQSNQVAWLEDGNIILNWIDGRDRPDSHYCLSLEECRDQIIMDWQDDILYFDFLPGRNDVFVVLVASGIYAVEADDRSERNIQPIYLGEDLDFRKNDRDQIIFKEDLVFYEINL